MRHNRRSAQRATIDRLEQRVLLATIQVTDFGARPNDGGDDSSAIRSAINASRDGDTIVFSGGTFNVNSQVNLKGNRTYKGDATLKRPINSGFIFGPDSYAPNITIDGLTFEGGGYTSNAVPADNLSIRNSTFKNMDGGYPNGNAIFWAYGAKNSDITNNRFINVMGEHAIYGFSSWDNTDIKGNYFEDVHEPIHLWYHGDGLRITDNVGIRTRRMAFELQGENARNTLIENNHFTQWRSDRFHDSFGFSIMNYGYGTIVRNNFLSSGTQGQKDSRAKDAPLGIEFAGHDAIVEGNVVEGFNEGIQIVHADDTVVRNNVFRWNNWVGIWRTGTLSARNLKIHNNVVVDAAWGMLMQGSNTQGGVVEGNSIIGVNRRADRGIYGHGNSGILYKDNKFQNNEIIWEEPAGPWSASGNAAYNSGHAFNNFIAHRSSDSPLRDPGTSVPPPSTNPPPTSPPPSNDPGAGNGNGNGLLAEYFTGRFGTQKLTRTDANVNYGWGYGSPDPVLPADNFTVRWTGQVQPKYSEEYTFYTRADDGVRLWVNGQLLVDNWVNQAATERSGKVRLEAGKKYDIKMEYYEAGNEAIAQLRWSSASQAKEVIPSSQLYPGSAGDNPAPEEPPTSNPPPTNPPTGSGEGSGLLGEYFNGRSFITTAFTRTDGAVDFSWGYGRPASQLGTDNFAVRWSGYVEPKYSEEYTFYTRADDGVRLWVNGQLLVDNWVNQAATERSGKVRLEAGKKYDIKMEYYEAGNEAIAQLRWSSASQGKEIIPSSQLYPSGTPVEPQDPTPPQEPDPETPGVGNGLAATYYAGHFSTQKLARTDAEIAFNWGYGSPASALANDNFSVRWVGKVEPKYSEEYTFYTRADDGVRLWVNGQLLVDNWVNQAATERSGKVRLEAGKKYDIKMEYYEAGNEAIAQLRWSSASQAKSLVPASAFFTA